eukprot:4937473-Pleurochrysis_carterae.AAC.2
MEWRKSDLEDVYLPCTEPAVKCASNDLLHQVRRELVAIVLDSEHGSINVTPENAHNCQVGGWRQASIGSDA